jgi:hypothetical protein
MAVMELKDKRSSAKRVRNCGARQTGIDGKCWSSARGRNVTCALRSDEAKRTLRRGRRLLSAIVSDRRIGSEMGSKATEDKSIRRSPCRHTEPDARHYRLDGERISDRNGQKTASRS